MGALTEAGLDALIAAGCPACHASELVFRSYVDGKLPILGGEPVDKLTWVYDGEKFVDGVFEVRCAACAHVVMTADLCPRCHVAGGLARALASTNRYAAPSTCPSCDGEDLRYVAMVPARVSYHGVRADKARTATEFYDAGFHGYRVDCVDCGTVAERVDRCPLCDGDGPLRVRPG